ncbi:MAG: signal recognition particle-docking protein FtsY [Desulfarculus sp.]|nr:signal recognition particle-docking protein FtsY [Pseudomonadota bacterium]MBU4597777.1 signal recognition particle-docking protein FtsY [Pseudomonadota bacterium]MBV1718218.1 signal recognition particle-docking protein FtsY [Desulfarculus sp.]MBV1737990.1 signal recognition particle-docking protein FtsY [Desulfarculus sp.]MBV1750427.1 signal recognition particle-docking protein FtsY [Desulfarculus sp.]
MSFFDRFKKKKAQQEQNGQTEAQEQAASELEDAPQGEQAPQPGEPTVAEAVQQTIAPEPVKPKRPPQEEVAPPAPQAEEEAEARPEPEAEAEPEVEPEPEPSVEEEPKLGLWGRLGRRLKKTKDKIGGSIDRITLGKKIDDEVLDDLEEVLVTADLGVHTSLKLIEQLRGKVARKELDDAEALKQALRKGIAGVLHEVPPAPERDNHPHVIMVVGVNGVGKTTSIGKLAHFFKSQGRSVLLAAGDTFRAAANEQLTIWSERVGCDIVGGQEGADPSAVAFDAVEAALNRGRDLVLIDTAGRLHTKVNLMEELKKIHRVLGKKLPGAPHEVILVLDATTGQNALQQAKLFNQVVPLTGLVLTKLDGTAKGGVVVAISGEMKLPICFVGLGEGMEDLKPFEAEGFAEAIF